MRFAIPECNMESLEKKLTRIQNKCRKYGCEFRYEKLGERFEDRDIYEEVEGPFGEIGYKKYTVTVKVFDIEVEGTAAVNGWQFAASLEYTEKGNIIKSVGGLEIPKRYYDCAPWCEHCKTTRDRKHSYIVYNGEEFKQVGKACLKDFTGGLSAEAVANLESYFKECQEASEFRGGSRGWYAYFDVKKYAKYVAEVIRLYGYSKNDGFGMSTADRAREFYRVCEEFPRIRKDERVRVEEGLARGFDIKNSAEQAETVLEWVEKNEREDNYFHNLKVACSLEYVTVGQMGLIASAFPAYDRELEYEAERREREAALAEAIAKSSWVGEVGDKVSIKVSDYSVITCWETQWGTTAVFKLVDENGRECTWKTSKWICREDVVGKVVKATVKEQKEYRGVKQTELTRCRIA